MIKQNTDFLKEIEALISLKQEGPYWDFKGQWHENKAELLVDILNMANNLVNRDAFIIIGVDESNDFSIKDISDDCNRKDTAKLTDFLRTQKFAGDFRPIVTVHPITMENGTIDVIVIHNSTNTPFFLREDFKCTKGEKEICIRAGSIYVRTQDTNTPKDKTADYHNIEYLWKKRFGMLLTPYEKVTQYLQNPLEWVTCPSDDSKRYYKNAPEYTIEYSEADRNSYEYYLFEQDDSTPHWYDIKIYYHQTVLAELGGVDLDGARYFTSTPRLDGFRLGTSVDLDVSYRYMVKGDLNYIVHLFYYNDDGDDETIAHDRYMNCILLFNSESEADGFKLFAKRNWSNKGKYIKNIRKLYINYLPEHLNPQYFIEQYKNIQILKQMLDEYRSSI